MNPVVKLTNLTKRYRDTVAVSEVSLSLYPNKIYGLLGRNGAGKSTLMQMLTGQTFPTSGNIAVFGAAPAENPQVLDRICFIKESMVYPDGMSVADVLRMSRERFPNWDDTYAKHLVDIFELPPKRVVKKLSRGMTSALGVVIGLAARAELTIFDEPYLGLDAVARQVFYDELLKDFADFPRTIILSTHLIDEVSHLLEYAILIDRGAVSLDADVEELRGAAIQLTGPQIVLSEYVRDKQVLHVQQLGSVASYTLLAKIPAEERTTLAGKGVEFAPISLQELMVGLARPATPHNFEKEGR